MCDLMERQPPERGVGLFRKGNEPADLRMAVEWATCRCGSRFWARIRAGTPWVEAERVSGAQKAA